MFLPVLLVVLLAVALTRSAFAGVIDQKQELDSAVAYGFPGSDQMLGQEFKPSLPILEAVEVKLENTGGGVGGYTFTLTIRDGTISGAILASASQLVDHDFNGWLRFTLTPLYVTPGSTYVMRLQATSAPFAWLYAETLTVGRDPYPNGRLIQVNPVAGYDFTFRTYGSSPAVGGVVFPGSSFALLAPYLVMIGLVAVAATVYVTKRR